MSKAQLCEVCGVQIEVKATGRPPKHCPTCREKQRKEYQRQQYLKRAPSVPDLERVTRQIRREHKFIKHHLKTRKGSKSSLSVLRNYEMSQTIKDHQNVGWQSKDQFAGGSGYDEVLYTPEHLKVRTQVLKSNSILLTLEVQQFLLKSRLQHGFTVPRKRGMGD